MGGAFAGGGGAIMTAGTGTGDSGMIEVHGGPVGGDMTIVTDIGLVDRWVALFPVAVAPL